MERESFEDKQVAEILNNHFISIKVDREERGDIDSIYMTFCQAYTGSGGWPLTIIMTPDKQPFFAGTYFPKRSRYGREGLIDLLNSINEMWVKDKKKLIDFSDEMVKSIQQHVSGEFETTEDIENDIDKGTVHEIKQSYEKPYGGFSKPPKFPTPHNIFFLLMYYYKAKDNEVLAMIENTLQSMYKGGIFDHIGFGFARYSTDEKWLVPHFEKMLYDNALLSFVYTEAYKATGKKLYKEIAEKIFSYVLRNMTSPEGGFYSAEDADSEGVEGKFYVWDVEEIESILGSEEAKLYCKTYDITERGNFERKNIPNLINLRLEDLQEDKNLKSELEYMRKKLYEYREKRVHPFKDDKILTSWNGLMMAALAHGGKVLENKAYIDAAKKSADFILSKLVRTDGRLLGRYREGEAANLGLLDDYAFFIWGLIEIYEADSSSTYLNKALELNDEMIKLFYDNSHGGLYLYAVDSEKLIVRPKELYDGAIPSGNSAATLNIVRLSKITSKSKLNEIANRQFSAFGGAVNSNPIAYTHFVTSFMLYNTP